MKNSELQKGIKDIQDIKLSSDEKMNLFAYLDVYSKEHPVNIAPKVSMWAGLFVHYRYSYMVAVLLLCILVGGTVTYAAESSLPGDALYTVKIYFNEPVKSITKVTPEAKARFEEEKVIKRLDEVQQLVKTGRFDDQKRIQVENEVEKSVKSLNITDTKKESKKNINKNLTSTDIFRKDLDSRFQNIKEENMQLKLDILKKNDNNDQVEKFEKKIKIKIGGFENDEADKNDNKNDNKNNDKKNNNKGSGLLR